jgi:flagellar biosynthesis protein FlhF
VNLHKFVGQTAREAMQKMREVLGDDAILIRTRSVPEGVEILAMPEQVEAEGRGNNAAGAEVREAVSPSPAPGLKPPPRQSAPEMSTLSFQQFVRQRMAREQVSAKPAAPVVAAPAVPIAPSTGQAQPRQAVQQPVEPVVPTLTEVMRPMPQPAEAMLTEHHALQAIQEMRGQLSEQMSGLMWAGSMRSQPVKASILSYLYQAGWSAQLGRKLADRVPVDLNEAQALQWVGKTLERLLLVDTHQDSLMKQGGIVALTGSTGVGKTTSTAKIAAHFALRHGAQSVGLITVDTYRVGGHDQLRTLGRMIGVPVHLAQDAGSLAEFLSLFMNKRLVLIDTVGMGQNDQRLDELLLALRAPRVQRVMVLNCAAQAQVTEQVMHRYQASQCSGVILAKTDEASQLALTLDAVIRHRLRVLGVADGQRIPDDWQAPDAGALIAQAAAYSGSPVFENSLDEILTQVEERTRPTMASRAASGSSAVAR